MTAIDVTLEDGLAQAFQAACDQMGMTAEDCLLIFIKQVILEHKMPFEVSASDLCEFIQQSADNSNAEGF